jgi:hypothetical protein
MSACRFITFAGKIPDRLILQLKGQYQWRGLDVESQGNHISRLFAANELTEPALWTSNVSAGAPRQCWF